MTMVEIMMNANSPTTLIDENLGEISEWSDCLFHIGQDCTNSNNLMIVNAQEALQILHNLDLDGKLSEFLSDLFDEMEQ